MQIFCFSESFICIGVFILYSVFLACFFAALIFLEILLFIRKLQASKGKFGLPARIEDIAKKYDISDADIEAAKELRDKDQKLEAIKLVKLKYQMKLAEAKAFVESL